MMERVGGMSDSGQLYITPQGDLKRHGGGCPLEYIKHRLKGRLEDNTDVVIVRKSDWLALSSPRKIKELRWFD